MYYNSKTQPELRKKQVNADCICLINEGRTDQRLEIKSKSWKM